MTQVKIVIEKYPEGYVAYPLGLKGVVVGEGDTYEEALEDVKSAIKFHIETFGEEVFETGKIMETFIEEAVVTSATPIFYVLTQDHKTLIHILSQKLQGLYRKLTRSQLSLCLPWPSMVYLDENKH